MSYTGKIELEVVKKQQKTVLSSCYQEGAFRASRPIYTDEEMPLVYLVHVGGGYVDGDSYYTVLKLEESAALTVATQSSTKVYKTPVRPVSQKTAIHLKSGSVLEYVQDPLIAYEAARFVQETSVYMEGGASLFYSDIITPGWAHDGSLFAYGWIRSKLKVWIDGELILFDHLRLEPDHDIGGILQMDGFTHLGTFTAVHPLAGREFLDALYERLEGMDAGLRFGLSILPPGYGMVLRVLGNRTGSVERLIEAARTFARETLLHKDSLFLRKY
ncbi:urease accessory protein UreD [Weizmannia acidilactici]|uniref:Urease accessory protein UreD n=1 Tax=Weizmannia acidilactici TaxID=2607726 RepID=A0A5J4J8A8_9BACI|nr:urease accessory protein UreD [Weizmannia acidilactici]GER67931.1 urease accessory protein UreD [Weizmannia acidilactici]GER71122.1 urease accessory protein UreD [Weizmannia acidilactici]GER73832.1 urease accessory protein UreD [Weizmannia acidilactici]